MNMYKPFVFLTALLLASSSALYGANLNGEESESGIMTNYEVLLSLYPDSLAQANRLGLTQEAINEGSLVVGAIDQLSGHTHVGLEIENADGEMIIVELKPENVTE